MGKFLVAVLALLAGQSAFAQAYVVADRGNPDRLRVLGVAGLYPEGCPSGAVNCFNVVVEGKIERIGFVDGEDFPNLLRVRDTKTGRTHSIKFPYQTIWNDIGTAESSWLATWLEVGMRVTIIGVIGGSSGAISIDSIYSSDFLMQEKLTK
jgi:hypothetical protein